MPLPSSQEVISLLSLSPHPEGGFYRQTFADEPLLPKPAGCTDSSSTSPSTGASNSNSPTALSNRPGSTQIYYLLPYPHFSSLHRIDAVEAWHYYMGTCALEIVELDPDVSLPATTSTGTTGTAGTADGKTPMPMSPLKVTRLGTDLIHGERPQHVVPKGRWFGARLPQGEASEGDWVLVGCTVAPGFVFEGGGFEMAAREVLEGVFEAWLSGGGQGGVGEEVRKVVGGMCRQ